jgi:large conductance mechanosensitive channel
MLQGFKQFILRGNVVDLAVGVVIGAAFGNVINALVSDILTPLIGAIAHIPDLSTHTFTIRGSEFKYGHFLNAVISFLLTAAAIYFFVVLPINKLTHLRHKEDKPADPTTKKCSFCMTEINIKATRCPNCTSELNQATA